MRRREFFILFGSAVTAWPRTVWAQQFYQRFITFLIDLPGWTGLPPTGAEKETKGGRVITASRFYQRGDARFNVSIMSGDSAARVTGSHAYINIRWAHESTSTIDGFRVRTQSTPMVVLVGIALGPDGTFSLIFNGVSEDEAMSIAQKFDWKGVRALIAQ
jgi:hypothetical protein